MTRMRLCVRLHVASLLQRPSIDFTMKTFREILQEGSWFSATQKYKDSLQKKTLDQLKKQAADFAKAHPIAITTADARCIGKFLLFKIYPLIKGHGATHGTDFENLESILKDGLWEDTALDMQGAGAASGYDVMFVLPFIREVSLLDDSSPENFEDQDRYTYKDPYPEFSEDEDINMRVNKYTFGVTAAVTYPSHVIFFENADQLQYEKDLEEFESLSKKYVGVQFVIGSTR